MVSLLESERETLITEAVSAKLQDRFQVDSSPRPEVFNPLNPYDASLETFWNAWIHRTLFYRDPATYTRLFEFATVTEASRKSPLVIELTVAIGIGMFPAAIAVGIMRAVANIRKADAEARIREAEADSKEEEVRQRRLNNDILTDVRDVVHSRALAGKLEVPDEVFQAAAGHLDADDDSPKKRR